VVTLLTRLVAASLILLIAGAAWAQEPEDAAFWDPVASGGPLIAEQASYRVHYYDLELTIDPAERSLAGRNVIHAEIVLPTQVLAIDLDTTFAVHAIQENGIAVPYDRRGGRLFLDFGRTLQPGRPVEIAVEYAGRPRVAPNPPWVGGFTWVDRPDGTYWVGVSNQGEGADLWWPVKDHPSDRPDSMRVAFTVPQNHDAISNGRLLGVTEHEGTRTFEWFVSTPINNYSVSVYVGPFVTLEAEYVSVDGNPFPFTLHVLPEAKADASRQLPQFVDHMRFMEETFGPYPFRADKYAVVHAPYLGMEHQTAIAYGDEWQDNAFGFDWLHLHELAHEWFANQVTVPDWSHFWVHEGFAMYVEALYAERLGGLEHYHRYMQERMLPRIANVRAVVPQQGLDAQSVYFGRTDATDQDVYFKGAWFLHTLRWAFRAEQGAEEGDRLFFQALRSVTYPERHLEEDLTCSSCRFVTSTDVQRAMEAELGNALEKLFRLYLEQPEVPNLRVLSEDGVLELEWLVPAGLDFDLPVEVEVDGVRHVVMMPEGRGSLEVSPGEAVAIDPDMWILKTMGSARFGNR